MAKKYPCNFCHNEFVHTEMWASRRSHHIKTYVPDTDERHVYYYCCFECEAWFQFKEEEDTERKQWMNDPEGWVVHQASVKSQIALSKSRKHKVRARLFSDAIEAVRADGNQP